MTDSLTNRDASAGHRIVRNSAINLAAFFLNAAFNLLTLLVLARALGVAAFGKYSVLYNVMFLTQLVSEMGLTTILACRIAADMETWKKTAAEATGWLLLVTLVSVLGLVGAGALRTGLTSDSQALLLFTLVGIGCGALHVQRFCAGVFQAFELFQYDSIGKVLQAVLYAGSVLGAYHSGVLDLFIAVLLLVLSHAVTAGFLALSYWLRWGYFAFRLNRAVIAGWWSEAGPLGMADVLRRLTWQLDVLLLALLQADAIVGVYSVAARPLATLNWAPQVILMAILPSFARMAGGQEGDQAALSNAFSKTIRLLWAMGVPVAVVLFLFAEPAALFLGGPAYLEAASPMRVLSVVIGLLFVSIPFRFLFAAMAKTRTYLLLVVLTLAFEMVWGLLVIPRWGLMGASWGNLMGELLFTAASLFTCKLLQIGRIDWGSLVGAAVAGFLMGVALWSSLAAPAIIQVMAIGIASVLYLVLCVFFNVIHPHEWRHALAALAGFIPKFSGRRRNETALLPVPLELVGPDLQGAALNDAGDE